MSKLFYNMIYNFFIGLGVILGGSLFASVAAFLCQQKPMKMMLIFCDQLKLWAIVVALGGTFSSFEVLDAGILKGDLKTVIKQLLYILSAFTGAHLGYLIIYSIGKGHQT